ncbi:MAG TPA: DNA-binding domain-containing protein [Haliangiales bacterium]|nr:DNA-binding domain-containing protein [Haliangiales bacterium]
MADLPRVEADMLAAVTSLDPPDELAFVVGDDRLDAAGRIGIYRDMYFARMAEAMAATFPKVAARLGHDEFEDMTAGFIDAYPSRHPSLRWVGRELAQFLAAHDQPEWLCDLARLEWARADVFDARDEAVVRVAELQALDPTAFAALEVKLIEAHRVVAAATAVDKVWRGGEPEPGPRALLVWRQGVEVFHRPLEPLEARVFPVEPTPFAALCERIADEVGEEEAAQAAFRLLARWAQDELLAR